MNLRKCYKQIRYDIRKVYEKTRCLLKNAILKKNRQNNVHNNYAKVTKKRCTSEN